jgi:nicotinamidase-related amidase
MTGKPTGLRFGPLGISAAHICVDMQRMFSEGTPWATGWMEKVLPDVVRLCEATRARTIFTRFIPARDRAAARGAWRRYYDHWQEMTLGRLDPGLLELVAPLPVFVPPALVLDKVTYSPWTGVGLQRQLASRHIDTLVISGGETDVCVLATVMGAVDAGFRTIVATDALCSSANSMHDAIIDWYHDRLAQQVEAASVDEIIANWSDGE